MPEAPIVVLLVLQCAFNAVVHCCRHTVLLLVSMWASSAHVYFTAQYLPSTLIVLSTSSYIIHDSYNLLMIYTLLLTKLTVSTIQCFLTFTNGKQQSIF